MIFIDVHVCISNCFVLFCVALLLCCCVTVVCQYHPGRSAASETSSGSSSGSSSAVPAVHTFVCGASGAEKRPGTGLYGGWDDAGVQLDWVSGA
jgi:hypothetical protein